jgi:hypothetical protein
MTQDQFLDQLKAEVDHLKHRVHASFYYADGDALNAPPGPGKWSALACLEHLSISNHFYNKQLKKRLQASTAPKPRIFKGTGWLGHWLTRNTEPDANNAIKFKMKTFKVARPRTDWDEKAVLQPRVVMENYLQDVEDFYQIIEMAREADLRKVKIRSFLGKWLPLSATDALPFVLAHNRRHVLQAERALQLAQTDKGRS